MFTRSSSAEPRTLEPRTTRPTSANSAQPSFRAASSGEKSIIGNDLKIIGQGLKIFGRGLLQVDGEIEGDVHAAEVIVGEKGQVSGLVAGQQVVVRGKVSGVICGQTVALQAHHRLTATSTTCRLRSNKGRSSMAAAVVRRAQMTSWRSWMDEAQGKQLALE